MNKDLTNERGYYIKMQKQEGTDPVPAACDFQGEGYLKMDGGEKSYTAQFGYSYLLYSYSYLKIIYYKL